MGGPNVGRARRIRRLTRSGTATALAAALAIAAGSTAFGAVGTPVGLAATAGAAKTVPTSTAPKPAARQSATAAANAVYNAARTQAEKTGKPVTVDAGTDERTTVVARPDGKFEMVQYAGAQRVKLNGVWTPIDSTLAFAPDGSVTSKATTLAITLSGGGAKPLAVEDDRAGHSLSIAFPATLPKPKLAGNTATYPDIYPGVDLRMTVNPASVSDLLIVHDAAAAANPALKTLHFALSGTGVTVSTSTDGAIHAKDKAGKDTFVAPTPQMWDSTGATSPAALSAARTAGAASADSSVPDPGVTGKHAAMPAKMSGNGVDLTPDPALLHGPGTNFPLYLDPTFEGEDLNHWLEVYQGGNRGYYDSTGYVSATYGVARVGWDPGSGYPAGPVRSLMEFTTSPVQGTQFSAIDEADVILSADPHGALCSTSTWMQLWATNPIAAGQRWSDVVDGGGNFNGQSQPADTKQCLANGDVNFVYTQQYKNLWASGHPTATIGVKEQTENSQYPRTAFRTGPPGYWYPAESSRIRVVFDLAPTLDWVGIAGQNACGTLASPAILPRTSDTGYNLNAQITGNHIPNADGTSHDMYVDFSLTPTTSAPAVPGPRSWTSGYAGNGSTTVPPAFLPLSSLQSGIEYQLSGHVVDAATMLSSNWQNEPNCWFIADFSPPTQPAITSGTDPASGKPAYPPMGTGAESPVQAGTALTNAFTLSSTSGSGNPAIKMDHYDYAINTDASMAGAGGAGCPQAGQCGTIAGTGSVRLNMPAAVTHFGANYLYARAVDSGGNTSTFAEYEFYVPAPFVKTVFGNVTGDGIPDIVSVLPPSAGSSAPQDLVSYPTSHDPSKGTTNWGRSAPAAAAPDGVSWADTDRKSVG